MRSSHSLLTAVLIAIQPVAHAQMISNSSYDSGDDCTDIAISYKQDPALTREELIANMDRAFFESLHKFDTCQGSQARNAQDSARSSKQSATASTSMSGTESEDATERPEQTSDTMTGISKTVTRSNTSESASNGKVPEDIPFADNDSVLEAQIRKAAMNETDADTREKLWNEYRKYKGLPRTKKSPE